MKKKLGVGGSDQEGGGLPKELVFCGTRSSRLSDCVELELIVGSFQPNFSSFVMKHAQKKSMRDIRNSCTDKGL